MASLNKILSEAMITYTPRVDRDMSFSLKNIADALDGVYGVYAGWFCDGSNYENGTPVYEVARLQEYGGESDDGAKIPPRPFMRPAFDGEKNKWADFITRCISKALSGKGGTIQAAFAQLGAMIQGDIQEYIHKVTAPPLAKRTLEQRAEKRGITMEQVGNMDGLQYANFSKPLEDTGQMISSVSFKTYAHKGGSR